VFADFQDPDASVKYLKVQAAGEIIDSINKNSLTVRAAAAKAEVDAADIQRIRNADLAKFTLDRLLRIASRLGRQGQEMSFIQLGFGTVKSLVKARSATRLKGVQNESQKTKSTVKSLSSARRTTEVKKSAH
jgi:hypothetical protein